MGKEKTAKTGLDCAFVNGDATAMPFEDNAFDLCYSYTVAEHIPTELFLKEQRRVLKPGGRISVMSVRTRLGVKDENWLTLDAEERSLFEKAWKKAGDFDRENSVSAYEATEHAYP